MSEIAEEIRKKVETLLTDDSLGAWGKKFDHDHHVQLRTTLSSLLEEDIPTLLEENERLRSVCKDHERHKKSILEENHRLRKALSETSVTEKLLRADVEMFRAELDQVKRERDRKASALDEMFQNREKWRMAHEELSIELAEKDKVLEWIRDAGTDYQSINKARDVLFQYKKGESTDASKDA